MTPNIFYIDWVSPSISADPLFLICRFIIITESRKEKSETSQQHHRNMSLCFLLWFRCCLITFNIVIGTSNNRAACSWRTLTSIIATKLWFILFYFFVNEIKAVTSRTSHERITSINNEKVIKLQSGVFLLRMHACMVVGPTLSQMLHRLVTQLTVK